MLSLFADHLLLVLEIIGVLGATCQRRPLSLLQMQVVLWLLFGCCLLTMVVLVVYIDFSRKQADKDLKEELTGTKDDQTIKICACADNNDLLGLVAMINSVLRNTKHSVKFYILASSEAKQHLITWLKQPSVKSVRYEVKVFEESSVQGVIKQTEKKHARHNPMNIARLYYPDYFPELHGKVVHLDADIIVQGDISELWKVHLKASHVIAVSEDCRSPSKRFTSYAPYYSSYLNFENPAVKSLHIDPMTCAFNTGMYIFDIDLWRSNNITDKLYDWLVQNTKSDIFSSSPGGGTTGPPYMIVFYKQYTAISDPTWHVRYLGLSTSRHLSDAFIRHGKLLHWNGPHKPWLALAQYSQIWDKYMVKDPLHKYRPMRRARIV